MISVSKPRRSAHFKYIFSSISAQSCDSVPPAPGWIVQMALRASDSPDKSISVSASLISRSSRSTRPRNSPRLSASSSANSKRTEASEISDSNFSWRATAFSRRLRRPISFCASSWSDQKSDADACPSMRFNSSRFAGTSKKPPELFDPRPQVFIRRAQIL